MISHIGSNYALNENIYNRLSDIKLFSKGDIAYNQHMDFDENDVVYMAEYKEYCDENSLVEKDINKLASLMEKSKMMQDIEENKKETQAKEETEQKPKEKPDEVKVQDNSKASASEIINYKNAKKAYKATEENQQ